MRILVLFLLLSISCYSQPNDKRGWLFLKHETLPLDKQIHTAAGAVISYPATLMAYNFNGNRRNNAFIWGVIGAAFIGTLNEISDINTTGFDVPDLLYTTAGGVVGSFGGWLTLGRYETREQRKLKKIKKRDEKQLANSNKRESIFAIKH
jgi:hypothetical protein